MTYISIFIFLAYQILYTTDNSSSDNYWVSEIVEGELMSFTVKGLTPNTNYYFKIQAKNAAGYGPFSPFTSIKTIPGIVLINTRLYLIVILCYQLNVLIHFWTFILGGLPYNDGTSLKGIVIEKKKLLCFKLCDYLI